jgi:hypothetical protein
MSWPIAFRTVTSATTKCKRAGIEAINVHAVIRLRRIIAPDMYVPAEAFAAVKLAIDQVDALTEVRLDWKANNAVPVRTIRGRHRVADDWMDGGAALLAAGTTGRRMFRPPPPAARWQACPSSPRNGTSRDYISHALDADNAELQKVAEVDPKAVWPAEIHGSIDMSTGADVSGSMRATRERLAKAGTPISDISPYTARHTVPTQLVINGVYPHIKGQILGTP